MPCEGYGNSRPLQREFQIVPEHHLKMDTSDAYHLMKSLGYSEFSVFGWCDGGISAICLAAQFPTSVRKLAIWGSKTYLTEHDMKATEELEEDQRWNPRYCEAFEAVYGSQGLSQLWHRYTDSVRATYAQRDGDICAEEMSKVKCPTLILHGEKDRFSPWSHAEYMKSHISGSKLHVFPDGRHNLQVCINFNAIVGTFFKRVIAVCKCMQFTLVIIWSFIYNQSTQLLPLLI